MIKCKKIKYEYDDGTKALNDVDIDVEKGNIIAVIGKNGAGKSTVFKCFMGILKPTDGEVIFNGDKLKYNKKSLYELRKNVGMVFQDPDRQIFYSNVYDDVAFGPRNLGLSEEEVKGRVKRALTSVEAYDLKNKSVQYLSYGQKKRISIAGVLAMESKVIFFDEPAAGLDPHMTIGIEKIIKNLSKEGKKIIISSHDMNMVYKLCDYVYIIDDGKIEAEGSTKDVFSRELDLNKLGLELPWLVKLNKNMGLPLFKTEEELYEYWRNRG